MNAFEGGRRLTHVVSGLVLAVWAVVLFGQWQTARDLRTHARVLIQLPSVVEALTVAERSKIISPDLADTLADVRRRHPVSGATPRPAGWSTFEVKAPTGEVLHLEMPSDSTETAVYQKALSIRNAWQESEAAESSARAAESRVWDFVFDKAYGFGIAGVYLLASILGWIVRGFMGIPAGMDEKPKG